MPIMVAPRDLPHERPLNELDATVSVPIAVELARLMVPELRLYSDHGQLVWMGRIWDRVDDGGCVLDYPSSPFDIRLHNGICTLTTSAPFGAPLVNAWIRQKTMEPMVTVEVIRIAA